VNPEMFLFVAGVALVVIVTSMIVSNFANWYRARKLWAYVVSGDVVIRRPAKLTEEGVEVDGKVYPVTREAVKFIKRGAKTEAAVFVDATANAVYVWRKGEVAREAPPELLSKLALKRILRQLTRREVQILPFLSGILVGLLLLAAGGIVLYQQVVVPAESKAAAAEQVLREYNDLKSRYDFLVRENERLQRSSMSWRYSYRSSRPRAMPPQQTRQSSRQTRPRG